MIAQKKPTKDGCEKLQRITGTVQNPVESQIKVMSPSVIEKSKVKKNRDQIGT